MRRAGLLLVLLVAFSVDARRRAVRAPGDETTPAGWLAAYVLTTPELVADSGDLAPLRTMIGDAEVVALGEATHGTHEFYTVKLRATELTERSSAAAYEEALHNARVVVQSRWPFGPEREAALAANALWLREHRGAARKMIVWAHNEHVAKSASEWAGERPMGRALHEILDNDYFALCTLIAGGSFLSWSYDPRTDVATTLAASFPPINASYYESSIRQRGAPLLLIPLRGSLPSWLSTPSRYNASGTTSGRFLTGSLPEKFDAAIYVETSTPTHVIE